ncbi:MAG: hypothetical protein JWM17_2591, partial [Actinobacteria bacterium]|nr:hypothetical protein [Actinomycetota bacterium]
LYREHPSRDTRSRLAFTLQGLGAAEYGQGQYPEAIAWLNQARQHVEALYEDNPSPRNCMGLVTTLRTLSSVQRAGGDIGAAQALDSRAAELERLC